VLDCALKIPNTNQNIFRLYYISNPTTTLDTALHTVNTLAQGIENSYQTATRQAPWALQYRLFRDTIPPGNASAMDAEGKPKAFAHTLQHLLHLSSLDPNRTYTCIQPPARKSTVSAIPLRQQEAHAILLRNQFSALWQPRHILSIPQGTSYSAGLCTVYLGELRSTREGPQSGGTQSPGVLVCISVVIGADDPDDLLNSETSASENGAESFDFDSAQAMIRECWSKIKNNRDLGKSEVKEFMMATEDLAKQEKQAAIRMWCDALRLRG
jgi:hypothetical protein